MAGDIVFIVQEQPHSVFKRKGDDLLMNKDIELVESLCGFKFIIEHLDKRKIVVESKPNEVIKPDSILCIAGEGMPIHGNPYEHGKLFIHFNIIFPITQLPPDKCAALEALLPPRPKCETDDKMQKYNLEYVDPDTFGRGSKRSSHQAYDDSDDEEERGGRRVQCENQ